MDRTNEEILAEMIQRTYGGILGPMNSFNIDQKIDKDIRISESQVSSSYKASHIAVKVPVLEQDNENFDKM